MEVHVIPALQYAANLIDGVTCAGEGCTDRRNDNHGALASALLPIQHRTEGVGVHDCRVPQRYQSQRAQAKKPARLVNRVMC